MLPEDFPFDFSGDEYEGPPVTPSTQDSAGGKEPPQGPPPQFDSVDWDDVPCGRPPVVIPPWGPSVNDAIAAKDELDRLRNISEEMSVLVDEALLDVLHQSLPSKDGPQNAQ